ncbi:MAG: hypothetical protein GQ542_16210 [Desulforhopalus sp.]|nr:hypothetical protein [Desulforhopalus sp.]
MINREITFENRDEYGRKGVADKINKLFSSEVNVSPMIIDGRWGQGKTEFCYKLINQLEVSGISCVYIDAYRNDHIDDPLLMIFSAIVEHIGDVEKKEKLINKAIPVLAFGLKVVGKAAISWGLKQDTEVIAEDFEAAVQKSCDAIFDAVAKKLISDYQEKEANLDALNKALRLATESEKLFIFIDELDRCRPSFSIEIIEKIKHVFDIPSITFVLVTNSEQLKASVNHIYGQHIDAGDYINKFINFTVRLNQYVGESYNRTFNSTNHFRVLVNAHKDLLFISGQANINKFIVRLIENNNFSLRQVEKFTTRLRAVNVISNPPMASMPFTGCLILISIIFLDCSCPQVVDKIERGELKGGEVTEILNLKFSESLDNGSTHFIHMNDIWSLGDKSDPENSQFYLKGTVDRISSEYMEDNVPKLIGNLFINAIRTVRLT